MCCQVSHLEPVSQGGFFNTGTRPGQAAASEFLVIRAPTVLNAGFSVALIQQATTIGIYKCAPVDTKTEVG